MEETEIEQALEIARKTRDSILFGKESFEKNLHGVYTVAQILGRTDDLKWAESEITGYSSDDVKPSYRKNIFRRFYHYKSQIMEIIPDDVSRTNCSKSISEIERIIKLGENTSKNSVIADYDYIKKKCPEITHTSASWQFSGDALETTLSSIKLDLIKRLNLMIGEITYGKIPQNIFRQFQKKVNETLADSNPQAVSELNISIEGLGKSEDPERIAHVAFACRRLIKSIADNLFPFQNELYTLKNGTKIDVGEEKFLNRLDAYVDSINSQNRKFLTRKIMLLRDLYGEIPESINKGMHLNISNTDAEMLVIYSYIILGDIILEKTPNNSE